MRSDPLDKLELLFKRLEHSVEHASWCPYNESMRYLCEVCQEHEKILADFKPVYQAVLAELRAGRRRDGRCWCGKDSSTSLPAGACRICIRKQRRRHGLAQEDLNAAIEKASES